MDPSEEDAYLCDIQAGAMKLAREFSTVFSNLENLDFSSEVSSKIFFLRPDLNVSRRPILTIPTAFLFTTLGIAVSHQTMALKTQFLHDSQWSSTARQLRRMAF